MRAPARTLAGALVACGAVLLAAGCSGETAAPQPDPVTSSTPVTPSGSVAGPGAYAEQLSQEANRVRAAEGLDELATSRCLARAAARRAEELVGGPLEHRPLPDIAGRCTDTGRLAENLVRSAATPGEVVAAWMDSTGHRNNLVDPAMLAVGTGCRRDGSELLCVQLYVQGE